MRKQENKEKGEREGGDYQIITSKEEDKEEI